MLCIVGRACLLASLAVSIGCLLTRQPTHEFYSDVHIVEESGDRIGVELRLDLEANVVRGTVTLFEGWEPITHAVSGIESNGVMSLTGTTQDGSIELTGRRLNGRFVGKVVYRWGSEANELVIDLPIRPEPNQHETEHHR